MKLSWGEGPCEQSQAEREAANQARMQRLVDEAVARADAETDQHRRAVRAARAARRAS